MSYYLALSLLILLLALLWGALLLYRFWRRRRLWYEVQQTPLPETWHQALERLPHYRLLPSRLKERLHPRMYYFAQTRKFQGIGLEINDEIRAVISFYACLLVLEIPEECYPLLQKILVYPSDIYTRQIDEEGGVHREAEAILEGEAAGDTVVIVWHEARRQALHPGRHNVILHELAHILDFEEGLPDGIPPLPRSLVGSWTHTLYRRYQALKKRARTNRYWEDYRLLGAYAATNEAEFFAVVTELFFTRPLTLQKHFPDLYKEWRSFYRLDTAKLFDTLER
ncbi:M90 family metallopeptidase [Nitratifractor sp.]